MGLESGSGAEILNVKGEGRIEEDDVIARQGRSEAKRGTYKEQNKESEAKMRYAWMNGMNEWMNK